MHLIRQAYYYILQMIGNGRVPLCARNVLHIGKEDRGFWALMPFSGSYYPIFCYVDRSNDSSVFIRFCIGINYRSKPDLNGQLHDFLISLSPIFEHNYYFIVDTSDDGVYITADISIDDKCPAYSRIERAIRNLLAISTYLNDEDLSVITDKNRLPDNQRFLKTTPYENMISHLPEINESILEDIIPQYCEKPFSEWLNKRPDKEYEDKLDQLVEEAYLEYLKLCERNNCECMKRIVILKE